MPESWKQFQESDFPMDDYQKAIPIGDYEASIDGVCYSKPSKRGTGIHLFARHGETGKKHWFYVNYLPWHSAYGRAKELKPGDRIQLVVKEGRLGTGMVMEVNLVAMEK